jgi:hypothetical protein
MTASRTARHSETPTFNETTQIRLNKMSPPIKIAVLDDYQGISESKFKALDLSKYEVSYFKDTLLPYNHPSTPQGVKDQLVKRLESFAVIGKCTT